MNVFTLVSSSSPSNNNCLKTNVFMLVQFENAPRTLGTVVSKIVIVRDCFSDRLVAYRFFCSVIILIGWDDARYNVPAALSADHEKLL